MSKDVQHNPEAERAAISVLYQCPEMLGLLPWRKDLFFDYACNTLFEELEGILADGDPMDFDNHSTR
jgi:hypothetical protein